MSQKNLWFFIALLFFPLYAIPARAQSDPPKLDVSLVFTAIRQADDFFQIIPENQFPPRIRHNFGYGGRVTYNITSGIGVEGEVTYFPKERFLGIGGPFSTITGFNVGGKRTQGLFGIKAGKRWEKFGVFAKVRPGFMRLDQVPDCENSTTICNTTSSNQFAFDIGGILEYYPSTHTIVRFDAGDTLIRYKKLDALPGVIPTQFGGGTTNNAQYSVSLGFRF